MPNAARREGGRVVEVENLLFDARPARDARGCRVLPSLLFSAVSPRSEETYGPRRPMVAGDGLRIRPSRRVEREAADA